MMLPIEWREQGIQVRRVLAQAKDQQSSKIDRLDDLHAQFHMFTQPLKDLLLQMSLLYSMNETEVPTVIVYIENDMREFENNLCEFIKSSQVQKLMLMEDAPQFQDRHIICPQLPFPDYQFQFPEIGFLLIEYFSYKCLAHFNLYTALRSIEHYRLAIYYSIKISKTFSGLDNSLGGNPDRMLPCLTTLYMASLLVPNWEWWQSWMSCKLGRLERSGYKLEKKYKERLAIKWNMQDIVMDRLCSCQFQDVAGF